MFSKLAVVLLSAVAIVSALPGDDPAAAGGAPTNNVWNTTTKKCNVGELKCCQQLQKPSNAAQQNALGLISAALGGVDVLLGANCDPITVIGAAIQSCSAQPACCSENNMGGAVVLGCSPIKAL